MSAVYAKASIKTLTAHITASQIILERTRDERRRSWIECLSFQPMNTPDDARKEPGIEPPFNSHATESEEGVLQLSSVPAPKHKAQRGKSASAGVSAQLNSCDFY